MGFDSETAFESALIKCLVEEKGWKDGVIKYPTEKDLLDNWAKIIFETDLLMAELCRLSVTTKMTRTISRRRYRSKSLTAMK